MHFATGYKQEEYLVVMYVLSQRGLLKVNQLVTGIDPLAFMTIQEVRERSFSAVKEYL